jgi:restriction system protein
MARRKESGLEVLVELVSLLPPWLGVVLAVISYFALHAYASTPVAPLTSTKEIGAAMTTGIFRAVAMVMQYVVPVACLLGAGVSFLRRRKRAALHDEVASAIEPDALSLMTWQEFEQVVGEFLRRKGFTVAETGGGGPDGGIDLIAKRGSDRYLVQCKQWRARQVGVAPVRELFGVMAAEGAAGGYVVTSGVFTKEAYRFADGREIELIDGNELRALIRAQAPAAPAAPQAGRLEPSLVPAPAPEVLCPICKAPMTLRTARRGPNAGSAFYGCSRYPQCRGTRPA